MQDLWSAARESHPRPDFVREPWVSLNGPWAFAFDDEDVGLKEGWQNREVGFPFSIQVPFTYQTKSSGIDTPEHHEVIWYKRGFEVPEAMKNGHVLLKFGAVDETCQVFVNGQNIGGHEGGYTPFEFDITPYLKAGENTLALRVRDSRDRGQPRGKQYWQDGLMGCWYTACSGIWQSVYLEGLQGVGVRRVQVRPDVDNRLAHLLLELDGEPGKDLYAEFEVRFKGEHIAATTCLVSGKRLEVSLGAEALQLWSPEAPNLYDLSVTLKRGDAVNDRVMTYFGLRKIEAKNGEVLLNNSPVYQRLVLDQGYWPDGLMTPPDGEAIKKDVEFIKAFGFNGARKHQKIEDPRFYYWCDRLGMLCWGELPSAYEFTPDMMTKLTNTMAEFILRDFNHPCIIAWTPLNESWGVKDIYKNKRQQAFSQTLYHLCKALDGTRAVSGNDGWEQTVTDISALHDYADKGEDITRHFLTREKAETGSVNSRMSYAEGFSPSPDSAFLITEYGGIAMAHKGAQGRMANMDTWGYHGKVDSESAFLERYRAVTDAIRELPYCRGYCYTQLTDVMQEINGLLTPERVPKVNPEFIREINRNPDGSVSYI